MHNKIKSVKIEISLDYPCANLNFDIFIYVLAVSWLIYKCSKSDSVLKNVQYVQKRLINIMSEEPDMRKATLDNGRI